MKQKIFFDALTGLETRCLKEKFFAVLLCLCLFTPLIGTWGVFEYQKKQLTKEVKRRIIAGIDKKELVLLKFTEAEAQSQLVWEHHEEFAYRGEMYDIVETEIRADTVYYWCWWDSEETRLNQELGRQVASLLEDNRQKQENTGRLIRFFKSLFFEKTSTIVFSYPLWRLQPSHFFRQEFYLSITHSVASPPPKIV